MGCMVSSSRTESLAQRFAAYIDELHDFFRSRHVPFGTKQDLATFPSRLQDVSFQEEMVSMVRSIVYREDEAIPRTDLAELIAISLAGPELEGATETPTGSLPLLDFVTQIVRSQRFTLPPEPTAEEEVTTGGAGSSAPTAAAQSDPQRVNLIVAPEPARPAAATPPLAPTHPRAQQVLPEAEATSTNDRLSRALFEFSAQAEKEQAPDSPAPEPAPATQPTYRKPASDVPAYPSSYAAKPRSAGGFFRNAYWLPGVCGPAAGSGSRLFCFAVRVRCRHHPSLPSRPMPPPRNLQSPAPMARC